MLLSNAQTATYMKIFSTLIEKGTPCTVSELAEPTRADIVFTGAWSSNDWTNFITPCFKAINANLSF